MLAKPKMDHCDYIFIEYPETKPDRKRRIRQIFFNLILFRNNFRIESKEYHFTV
jgi:hypothetical protein